MFWNLWVQCTVSHLVRWHSINRSNFGEMNCIAFRYKLSGLLCLVLSVYIVILLIGDFCQDKGNVDTVYLYAPSDLDIVADVEFVSSNDFSLTHKNGKDENIQHTFVYTLQGEKLLRECIFDREKILLLTQTLVWFTHSTYQVSLPPVWHPSIPIAHRRLII